MGWGGGGWGGDVVNLAWASSSGIVASDHRKSVYIHMFASCIGVSTDLEFYSEALNIENDILPL